MDDAATLAAALSAAVGDLDVYIGRKAAEMAAPAIAEAERAANEAIQEVEGRLQAELQRAHDLVAELRRRVTIRDRSIHDAAKAHQRVAASLGVPDHERSWSGLADEVERQLAEDAATIERLRAEKLDAIQGHLVADVQLPAGPLGEGSG